MQAGTGQGMAWVEEEEGCKVVFLEVANHDIGSPAVGEHTLVTSVLCSWRNPGEQLSGNGSCMSSLPWLPLLDTRRPLWSIFVLTVSLKAMLCLFFPFLPMDGSKELFTSEAPNHQAYSKYIHFNKMQDIGSVHNSQEE